MSLQIFLIPRVFALCFTYVSNDNPILLKRLGNVSESFETINEPYEDENVKITGNNHKVIAIVKKVCVEITMEWHNCYMNYQVVVPEELCKISVGHMGNCDGNGTNDDASLSPDQYRIPFANQSLFHYTNNNNRRRRQATTVPKFECTSFDNCGNHTFRGTTFADLNFTQAQRDFCNDVPACMFDLAVTGDMEVAGHTKEAEEEITRLQTLTGNYPPNITSDGRAVFLVTVGEENVYTFTVTDDGDFNVTIEGGAPRGVLADDGLGTYTFIWTPTSVPTTSLSIIAIDSIGAATLHQPVLQVCACFNGGECIMEEPNLAEEVHVLPCNCAEAYTGDTCSEDRNGCLDIECFSGVECLDVPAPGIGAVCGACPTGFTGDGLKCLDLDECFLDTKLCNQGCTNTFGSFQCDCFPGYILQKGASMCADIDECSGINDCEQGCTNTMGSFNCTCVEGFTLDANGRTCTPKASCTNNPCSHVCAIIDNETQCFCPVGFELAIMDDTTCQDIDECARFSPCGQLCSNTEGSYECTCIDGHELQGDGQSCADIDECLVAVLESSVICTEDNTECLNTIGGFECPCVPGYDLIEGQCQRIVEVIPPPMVALPEIGNNNTVTFEVDTFRITELIAERVQAFRAATAMAITRFCEATQCLLIDTDGERNETEVTVQSQSVAIPIAMITVNSEGSPVLSFYVQLNTTTFVSRSVISMAVQAATDLYQQASFIDVNECENDNGGCAHVCTNTLGSFICSCDPGYSLATDGSKCNNVNECVTDNGGCAHVCTDNPGSFICSCDQGYSLATDGSNCDFTSDSTFPRDINGAVLIVGIVIMSLAVILTILGTLLVAILKRKKGNISSIIFQYGKKEVGTSDERK